jgi:TIR domain
MAFRIFISHSSHTDEDRNFVQRLRESLTNKGYEVLLDLSELQAADDWNEEIHEWLAACHAGIVLLTPHSIERPWVLKEATILTWRRSLDTRHFKLFPALFDDVTDAMLEKAKFAPLVIKSLQAVAGKTPEAIANEVAQIIGDPMEVETPLDQLAKVLADLLVPPNAGQSTAEKLARKLGVDEKGWVPNSPPELSRILLIAGRLVRENLGTYSDVYQLMKDLLEAMPSISVARKVLALVAPYWVSTDAAGRFCEVAARDERWAIAMNGSYLSKFTIEMYLLRAFPLRGQIYELKLPGGGSENMIQEIIEDVYAALEQLWGEDRATARELLDTHPDPLFVVLPEAVSDAAALAQLQTEFPHLTFILNPGIDANSLDAFKSLSNVECIFPAVDPNVEKKVYFDYVRTTGLLRGP